MDVEDELLGPLLDKDRLVAEQARTLDEKDRIIDELKKKAR
jgi:hypothetical protein